MGTCQAAEAATVVIQHPGNKIERVYVLCFSGYGLGFRVYGLGSIGFKVYLL